MSAINQMMMMIQNNKFKSKKSKKMRQKVIELEDNSYPIMIKIKDVKCIKKI